MKRQDKYPETSTFHFHNQNPHGRLTTDCVIRAISTATEIPYNQVVRELAELQCETGYDDGDVKLFDKYLASKGWVKYKQPRKDDGTKYTGREFCELRQRWNGDNAIANIGGGHIVAIVNGKVWDTWDCTHKCIGNYWLKR